MKKDILLFLALTVPMPAFAIVPSDIVSSDTCKDVAVQELVAAGFRVDCFNAVHGVVTSGVCTASGACEDPKPVKQVASKWKLLTQALSARAEEMSRWVGDTVTSVAYTAPVTSISFTSIRPFGATQKQVEQEECEQEKSGWWLFNLLPSFSAPTCITPEVVGVQTPEKQKRVFTEKEEFLTPTLSLYAFPESVRLQGRSTLVWVSENVQAGSCVVTGPGFKEKSDSGQGSTMALNEPTSFTLTCLGLNGEEVDTTTLVDIGL